MRRTSSQSAGVIAAIASSTSDVHVLRFVTRHQAALRQDRLARTRVRGIAGLDPVPRVEDVGAVVIARLGLDENGAAEDLRLELFPRPRSDHGDPFDVLRVLREKPDLLPSRGP